MCGIAGRLNFSDEPVPVSLIEAMSDALSHRGPDDSGSFTRGPVGLGHRRLSIIDLAGGHQPLGNEDNSIRIVFNGEIYNFPELRDLLGKKGHRFRTNSDTEVIVHLYEEYGVDCLHHLNGMFAFAIWDAPRQRLFLARDRLGKKPLVYALRSDSLAFASEIGALLEDRSIPREIDLEALDLYLALTYVPSPWTMVKAVRKLPPAHYLMCEKGVTRIERYWDVSFAPRTDVTEAEAAEEIRALLEDSVKRRLISDVPLGAFLSGGIDSGTVVALMTRLTGRPVRTFSIGFEDDAYGELGYARQVAERYGAEHTELSVRPQMVDILPRLVRHYGEPYGDGSAVPTYYVSRLAGESVKVVLSGDGGDEVFGGYPWYVAAPRHAELAGAFLRDGIKAVRSAWQNRQLRAALGAAKGTAVGLSVTLKGWRNPPEAFERLITFFAARDRRRLYTADLNRALGGRNVPSDLVQSLVFRQNGSHFVNQMFYADHHLYLPDDILVKVDIASMANSLEVRAPFLDYRLVELSASLPPRFKVEGTATKRILRQVVSDLLPDTVLNRPKVGFGLPIERWMREDLHPMACDLLLDSQAHIRDLFNVNSVRGLLDDQRTGKSRNGYQLWLLLIFELWCREILATDRHAALRPQTLESIRV